jgi:hypothetical protein
MSKLTVICEAWRPLRKNTLAGFASIKIVEMDLAVHDVAVHQKNDRTWAQLPGRPWVKDGAVVLDDNGRPQYSPLLEFGRRETRDAFSQRVVEAVLAAYPGALALEETSS